MANKFGPVNLVGLILLGLAVFAAIFAVMKFRKWDKQNKDYLLEQSKYKYGFMNTKGEVVIDTRYKKAHSFKEGLAAVKTDDLWGYIDKNGNTAIQMQFEYAFDFNEGLALVCLYPGYTDKEPDLKLSSKTPGKWGFIDKNGNFVIQPIYEYAESFSEGYAVVGFNPRRVNVDSDTDYPNYTYDYNYIDKKGKLLLPENNQFKELYSFSEGLALFRNKKYTDIQKYGFIDKIGNIVIQPEYLDAYYFYDGMAKVKIKTNDNKELWGYINKNGEMVIKPKYTLAEDFSCGYALVADTERVGTMQYDNSYFINKKGEIAFDKSYTYARSFYEDKAVICDQNSDYFIIDTKGNKIIKNENGVYFLWGFKEGIMPVNIYIDNESYGAYMDLNKNIIKCRKYLENFNNSYNYPYFYSEGMVIIKVKLEP